MTGVEGFSFATRRRRFSRAGVPEETDDRADIEQYHIAGDDPEIVHRLRSIAESIETALAENARPAGRIEWVRPARRAAPSFGRDEFGVVR